ncbi:ABC transporter substrate-binding protein [Amaricoccus solimangrovi]|uniref:Peptide ABC transporter substrate-binding protein n=1 Tax=Amaricoccus solimangrovi TaxID=2589815 RepID=A0A501WST7_9RHOB|nr:ABC transporter substrate-binding protein [Amaricoccus solimangrovi]TPE51425.1 peptide ABC transporter substrate-binding protein [Amaricoccus solimangrovi]
MKRTTLLLSSALALALPPLAPAFAQEGKDVTIVLGEDIDLMEPCMATRSNIGRIIMENVSETLTEYDVKSGKGVLPRLAESWEDMGGGTWRFHLRESVTFSDGSAFDAADVKASYERASSDKLTCETPRYFGDTKLTFDVVDEHTIDITADPAQPILPLLMSLVTIVPSETPVEFVREPVGTGPYKLASWSPGQSVVLERRDDYWGEQPAVEKATYVFRTDPAVAAAMVAQGEADLAPSISAVDATDSETDVSYLNSETTYLRLDSAIPPISDKRVREALNMSIDRDAFVGTLLPEGTVPAVAMVPPTTLGWNPDVKEYPYDPEKAKELLAAAKADGVPVDTTLYLIGRSNLFPGVTEVSEALQQMMQDVGFNVELQMVEVAQQEELYSKPFKEGRPPQMLFVSHDNSKGDPVFSMFFKYDSNGRQSGIADPKVDEMIAKASAATGEERTKDWQELFAYLHDEVVPDVLLFHMVSFARVGDRIEFTPTIATNSMLPLSEISFK